MDEWLIARDRLEVQLRGKYGEDIVNYLLGMVDKFIGYSEEFLNYWYSIGDEVRKLINDLTNGGAEVIIWNNTSGISIYYEHVTLKVDKTESGIIVRLNPKGLEGVTIQVPDAFMKTMSEEE